jgi:hypothetical protein
VFLLARSGNVSTLRLHALPPIHPAVPAPAPPPPVSTTQPPPLGLPHPSAPTRPLLAAGDELPEWLLFSPSLSEGRSPASGLFSGPRRLPPSLMWYALGASHWLWTRARILAPKGMAPMELGPSSLGRPSGHGHPSSEAPEMNGLRGGGLHGRCLPRVHWPSSHPIPRPRACRGWMAGGSPSQAVAADCNPSNLISRFW